MRTLQHKEALAVFCIIEKKGEDPIWKRAGVASVNSDGSLNVTLNGIPAHPPYTPKAKEAGLTTTRLHIRQSGKKQDGEKTKPEPAFLAGTQEKTRLNAFTVINREGKDSLWCPLGCAFVNADGSMNLKLDMYPVNGELCVRLPKPDDEAKQDEGDDEIPF